MKFTPNQEKAIELGRRNILVSAAAGSGKTRVLVERIIKRITDTDNPIDIDRLLVMTFTNAAAKEMKDRIRDAIETELKEHRGDEHLARQAVLVHNANITTIHGFCQSIIRDHFEKLSIDPGFRVGDENECKLLRMDTLDRVLEQFYEEGSQEFLDAVESFGDNRSDKAFGDAVMSLYLFAQSSPDPESFLTECVNPYCMKSVEEFEKAQFVSDYVNMGKSTLSGLIELVDSALNIVGIYPALAVYEQTLESDREMLSGVCEKEGYGLFREAVQGISFGRMASVKAANLAPDELTAKERVTELRDTYKGQIKDKLKADFRDDLDEMYETMCSCADVVEALIKVVLKFSKEYDNQKREKNIIDFSDMEHMAIRVVRDNEEVAAQYREFFEEIYVDEYQDSNLTQETLINLISRRENESEGTAGNVFMVGDVKQSIYRFRQARPDLFVGKYNSFTDEDSSNQRVLLNDNFRSRREVVNAVNEVFAAIMRSDVGGIDYDENAMLKYGAVYYDEAEAIVNAEDKSKVMSAVAMKNDTYKAEMVIGIGDDISKAEFEANIIANRIKQMKEEEYQVYDVKAGRNRTIQYRDIVILLRSLKGREEVLRNVLISAGIPVAVTSNEGYFGTIEVQTALAFLSVVDNPYQDIPLATVMKSPVGGFSNEEFALIKSSNMKCSLYEAVENVAAGEEAALETVKAKISRLLDKIHYYRRKSVYTPVDGLLREFIDKDYGEYVRGMDKGLSRMANLNMLVVKAEDYGRTSFCGLFNFVRYMDLVKKYEIDNGEVGTESEQDDVVRIMTIHKSKGLEFPVCFVSAIEKGRNSMDEKKMALWDVKYGLGINRVDLSRRFRKETIYKRLIKHEQAKENIAEEIRVLYVAMTRAREKLILVGCSKDESYFATKKTSTLLCSSYLDLLALANERTANGLAEIMVTNVSTGEIIVDRMQSELEKESFRDELEELLRSDCVEEGSAAGASVVGKSVGRESVEEGSAAGASVVRESVVRESMGEESDSSEGLSEELKEVLTEEPLVLSEIPSKLSVSDLKHKAIDEMIENGMELAPDGQRVFGETDPETYIPAFMRDEGETKTGGTFYGTAFHRILELWEYDRENVTESDVAEFVDRMQEVHRIESQQAEAVRAKDIAFFLNSEIGKRFFAAKQRGDLYREQPFVIGLPRCEVERIWYGDDRADAGGDDLILVQGIIDAFIVEDDEITILDYKTDYVTSEQMLIDRYKAQLQYYQKALQQITGKRIKELVIYSSRLRKSILVG